MIDVGCLENVDRIYGIYLWSGYFIGIIYLCVGVIMVFLDEFSVIFKGCGGYGVKFYEIIDLIVIMVEFILSV